MKPFLLLVAMILVACSQVYAQDNIRQLAWEDDLEHAEQGDRWEVQRGGAEIRDGKLWLDGHVWIITSRALGPDVRPGFDAQALPGVPPCDLSATLGSGDKMRWGYLLGFGAQDNRANHLKGPGIRVEDKDPPFLIEPDKRYEMVAQKEGLFRLAPGNPGGRPDCE